MDEFSTRLHLQFSISKMDGYCLWEMYSGTIPTVDLPEYAEKIRNETLTEFINWTKPTDYKSTWWSSYSRFWTLNLHNSRKKTVPVHQNSNFESSYNITSTPSAYRMEKGFVPNQIVRKPVFLSSSKVILSSAETETVRVSVGQLVKAEGMPCRTYPFLYLFSLRLCSAMYFSAWRRFYLDIFSLS